MFEASFPDFDFASDSIVGRGGEASLASGHTHDWDLSARVVAAVDVPVFLAGGLGPENVAEAIRRTRPFGVDSETRTSRDPDRRRKDPDRVRRFLIEARAAARGLGGD